VFASVCPRHVWLTRPLHARRCSSFFNFLLLTMAAPLAQVTLNLAPGLVAGVQPPAQPANPPTSTDVKGAVKLMADVAHELRQFFFSFLLFKWLRTRSLTFLSGLNTAIPDTVVEAVTFYNVDVIATRQLAQIDPVPSPAAAVPPAGPAGSPFLHFLCPYSSPSSPIGGYSPNPQCDCNSRS